jgi:hypothetical protein
MTDIDLTEIRTKLEGRGQRSVSIIEPRSALAANVGAAWRPIAQSSDPEERRLRALALWNREFLDLIPQYAGVLRTKLLDVRVCTLSDEGAILIYLFSEVEPVESMMIGWDPAGFGADEPIFWDSIPAPARAFLQHTHAGYNNPHDWESGGLLCPADMTTPAQYWGEPDGIEGWFENHWLDCEPIDSRRMLYVASPKSSYMLCTSPDAPAGTGLVYYDNEINLVDFFEELDRILLAGASWSGVL